LQLPAETGSNGMNMCVCMYVLLLLCTREICEPLAWKSDAVTATSHKHAGGIHMRQLCVGGVEYLKYLCIGTSFRSTKHKLFDHFTR
jgi:hypothetical protein